jgi:hypothetical protein
MNISSLLQSTDYYSYYRTKNNANVQGVTTSGESGESDKTESAVNAASVQSDIKPASPPPPPRKPDFENMSDEDLRSYLTKMQELTGDVSETEDETTVASMTDEELANVRSILIEAQQEQFQGFVKQHMEEMLNSGGVSHIIANVNADV